MGCTVSVYDPVQYDENLDILTKETIIHRVTVTNNLHQPQILMRQNYVKQLGSFSHQYV